MNHSVFSFVGLEDLGYDLLLLGGEGIAAGVRSLAPSIGALHLLASDLTIMVHIESSKYAIAVTAMHLPYACMGVSVTS